MSNVVFSASVCVKCKHFSLDKERVEICNSGRCGLLIPSIGSATISSDILICNFLMQDTPFGDLQGERTHSLLFFVYIC